MFRYYIDRLNAGGIRRWVYRGEIGNLRELVFGVLRKHRDDNICDYLQLRFVRRCDINEHISGLHADL